LCNRNKMNIIACTTVTWLLPWGLHGLYKVLCLLHRALWVTLLGPFHFKPFRKKPSRCVRLLKWLEKNRPKWLHCVGMSHVWPPVHSHETVPLNNPDSSYEISYMQTCTYIHCVLNKSKHNTHFQRLLLYVCMVI